MGVGEHKQVSQTAKAHSTMSGLWCGRRRRVDSRVPDPGWQSQACVTCVRRNDATASFGLWANAHFDEVCSPCRSQKRQGGKANSAEPNLECEPCHSGFIGLAPVRNNSAGLQDAIGAAPTSILAHRGVASCNYAEILPKFVLPTPQLHARLYAHCPIATGPVASGWRCRGRSAAG